MALHSLTTAQTGWDSVQQSRPLILLLIVAWGMLGCQSNIQAPRSADKHAQQESKSREAPVLNYPEHVAPPPAYGNKVVMAAAADPALNF